MAYCVAINVAAMLLIPVICHRTPAIRKSHNPGLGLYLKIQRSSEKLLLVGGGTKTLVLNLWTTNNFIVGYIFHMS